jgi:hypothetical protein
MDCAVDTMGRDEYYMLTDPIWRSVNPLSIGMLCLKCAEDRLGRKLHRGDFSSAPINRMFARSCAALAERLRRSRPAPIAARSGPKLLSAKALQMRLAKKKRTQSTLGRLSAALLPYRGSNGLVARGTLQRVLRELPLRIEGTPTRARSVGTRKSR